MARKAISPNDHYFKDMKAIANKWNEEDLQLAIKHNLPKNEQSSTVLNVQKNLKNVQHSLVLYLSSIEQFRNQL